MKTQIENLFNKFKDLKKGKKSLEQQRQTIETASVNLEGLCKEQFLDFAPYFNRLVEAREWEKIQEIIRYLDSTLTAFSSEPEIKLKFNTPKSGFPKKPEKFGPITDKNYFNELMNFLKKTLHKNVFEKITRDIEWSSELGR